jgi:hypothetical protein
MTSCLRSQGICLQGNAKVVKQGAGNLIAYNFRQVYREDWVRGVVYKVKQSFPELTIWAQDFNTCRRSFRALSVCRYFFQVGPDQAGFLHRVSFKFIMNHEFPPILAIASRASSHGCSCHCDPPVQCQLAINKKCSGLHSLSLLWKPLWTTGIRSTHGDKNWFPKTDTPVTGFRDFPCINRHPRQPAAPLFSRKISSYG